ncbi:hypothetical protein BDQ12DRAFT_611412 [Crucibulum laeve]|uniref:Hydrophobin n=1 Tax=Crucibulum laeve TaxID=68775 RepID=A0A5C3LS60_9AGAR|nr:hypothetical protein BDQ12DRAFT_611412 [Crucibulum laeve]
MAASQCPPGQLQCCASVQPGNTAPADTILALLGITVIPANTPVGLSCSPINTSGPQPWTCTQSPVCCTANGWVSLAALQNTKDI